MIKILMIEDDLELAEVLTEFLEDLRMEIITEDDPFNALSRLKLEKFDLVILDLTLPGMDGLEVCEKISQNYDYFQANTLIAYDNHLRYDRYFDALSDEIKHMLN